MYLPWDVHARITLSSDVHGHSLKLWENLSTKEGGMRMKMGGKESETVIDKVRERERERVR